MQRVEDGEDRDGVGRRQGRAKEEALDDGEGQALEPEERVQVDDDAVWWFRARLPSVLHPEQPLSPGTGRERERQSTRTRAPRPR